MREKKNFARPLSTKSAKTEEEIRMIEAYNAAMLGSQMTINRYGMDLSDAEAEDAASDAGLAVLINADFERSCDGYGWLCGRSSAIKAGQKATRDRKTFRNVDDFYVRWNGEDGEEYTECTLASDDRADSSFTAMDEAAELAHVLANVNKLPEKDRIMYTMLAAGRSYNDIAAALGCTVNSLYKRRIDALTRFKRISGLAA